MILLALVRLRKYFLLTVLGLLVSLPTRPAALPTKLLSDQVALGLLQKGLPLMYACEFGEARRVFAEVQRRHPQHPVSPLLDALMLFWQNVPFDNYQGAAFKQHVAYLEKTIAVSQTILDQDEDDVEGVFFMLTARGLLMQHYANMEESMKAMGEANKLYSLIKHSFDLRDRNVELYFMTGLYSYYREYYPERYPVYKPFVVFFKSGSKKDGLANLELCTQKAIFTASEAAAYLAHIFLRYEKNNAKALQYTRLLATRYPNNLHFVAHCTEILMLTRNFQEAEAYTQRLLAASRPYYRMLGKTFAAMRAELQAKDTATAAKLYAEAESQLKQEGSHADPYRVYVYAGLFRYHKQKGDSTAAKRYYKLAKDYDEYQYLKEEF